MNAVNAIPPVWFFAACTLQVILAVFYFGISPNVRTKVDIYLLFEGSGKRRGAADRCCWRGLRPERRQKLAEHYFFFGFAFDFFAAFLAAIILVEVTAY
jgi:hypothetical protein